MTNKLMYEVVPMSEVVKEDMVVLLRKDQKLIPHVDDERFIADTLFPNASLVCPLQFG